MYIHLITTEDSLISMKINFIIPNIDFFILFNNILDGAVGEIIFNF